MRKGGVNGQEMGAVRDSMVAKCNRGGGHCTVLTTCLTVPIGAQIMNLLRLSSSAARLKGINIPSLSHQMPSGCSFPFVCLIAFPFGDPLRVPCISS